MATKKQYTDNLNKTGLFFEELCVKKVKEESVRLKSEYPYSYSAWSETITGTADIISLRHMYHTAGNIKLSDGYACFVIECKKVLSDQKIWVFAKKPEEKPEERLNYFYANVQAAKDLVIKKSHQNLKNLVY